MNITLKDVEIGYINPVNKVDYYKFEHSNIYLLTGDNGTGKSTLLKSINGDIPLLKGEILIDDLSIELISKMQIVQNISSLFHAREVSNIPVFKLFQILHNYNIKFDTIKLELSYLNMDHTIEHNLSTLSDGMLQKVKLAAVLSRNTPITLLDEPTVFLDYKSKVMFWERLMQLKQNRIFIVSSHDLELARKYASHEYSL